MVSKKLQGFIIINLMKYYIIILSLILAYSCQERSNMDSEQRIKDLPNEEKIKLNTQVQEIGNLYMPEKMIFKEANVKKKSEKEDYQITLTNSDLLDTDLKNIEGHSQKIALFYYKFLVSNIIPLNLKKIIVRIEHKNLKVDQFEYLDENINKLTSSR